MTEESNDAVFVNRIVRNIYELCIDDIIVYAAAMPGLCLSGGTSISRSAALRRALGFVISVRKNNICTCNQIRAPE